MSPQAQELEALLDAEHGTLGALASLLDQEHDALVANDAQALEGTTERKNLAIQAHQQQQEKRLSWMAARGMTADTPLAAIVDACGATPRLQDLQAQLTTLAEECQTRNRRNGGLIVRLQDRTRGALDVLRREETSNIYSLSGAREQKSDSRTLGKA